MAQGANPKTYCLGISQSELNFAKADGGLLVIISTAVPVTSNASWLKERCRATKDVRKTSHHHASANNALSVPQGFKE